MGLPTVEGVALWAAAAGWAVDALVLELLKARTPSENRPTKMRPGINSRKSASSHLPPLVQLEPSAILTLRKESVGTVPQFNMESRRSRQSRVVGSLQLGREIVYW